jgi:hypothetical protein
VIKRYIRRYMITLMASSGTSSEIVVHYSLRAVKHRIVKTEVSLLVRHGASYPDSARIIPRKKRIFYFKFVWQVLGIRWFYSLRHDAPTPEGQFRLFTSMRV